MSSQVDENHASASAPSDERISRKGTVMKCSFCRTAGHNRSTCKEAPPSSNRRPGRKKTHLQSSQVESSSVILPCTPDASTQQTSTPAESGNQSTGRTRFYKPVRPFGFGVMVDEDSGRSVYNPGLRTEKVIEEAKTLLFLMSKLNKSIHISEGIIFLKTKGSIVQPLPI
ncbi:hypothetical protein K1719_030890 [Acacia pycnantha]|nr:hypothetical protein K1719_030890 [Acacia pycnantha]